MTNKKLSHKVCISQSGKQAVFRFSDKEFANLQNYSNERNAKSFGTCNNISMYAFFDYETTRSKYGRFASIFNFHKGDFMWSLE